MARSFLSIILAVAVLLATGTAAADAAAADADQVCSLPENGLRRVLITGSNTGLGLDTARYLAENKPDVTEIILAVRSQAKGDAAIEKLVAKTGRPASLFSVLVVSVGDIDDAKAAATKIEGKLDGIVLNAGGLVGGDSKVASGALTMHAVNTLGHAAFLETLIAQHKLATNAHVVFSGSEAARGVPLMGMAFPEYEAVTADAVDRAITDQHPTDTSDEARYGFSKSVMALYVSALARRQPEYVVLTVSPGATTGTDAAKNAPWFMRFMMNIVAPYILQPLGLFHGLEAGTQRYVDGLYSTAFKSGSYLASPEGVLTGLLQDQVPLYPLFGDEAMQEAAYEAVHRHI